MTDDEREAVKDLVAGKTGIDLKHLENAEIVSSDPNANVLITPMTVKVESQVLKYGSASLYGNIEHWLDYFLFLFSDV